MSLYIRKTFNCARCDARRSHEKHGGVNTKDGLICWECYYK